MPRRTGDAPRQFTHYWNNNTWDANRDICGPLTAIYGNQFYKRGVAIGDNIYVVTVRDWKLFLGARLEVGSRTQYEEPVKEDWKEEILAKPGTATEFDADREVPLELTERLVFLSSSGPTTLKLENSRLYHQRMRTMRELSAASAAELDCLLG